ncbi:MAG TPA: CAP domain-containing protein [Kofleriaceae bacterium]
MQRRGLLVCFLVACGGDVDPPTNGDASTGGDGGGSQQSDGGPRPDAPGGVGEPAELVGITLAHNEARADVVTGTPLPAMTWDPSLAQTAATWAAMCRDQDAPIGLIDHNPNRSVGHPFYVGENIFASSGTANPQQAVMLWIAEKSNYNYENNTCSGTCGHYTQVVWRESVKLGCAIGNCPGHTYPSSIICNYGPGGNDGSRPY